jgi:uncharacterized cupin superfamily protein
MGTAILDSTPIRPEWILSGRPIARSKLIHGSDDRASSSFIWECTAGRFNWYYEAEETIYFLEGNVVIKDNNGVTHQLGAGDTIFFPRGAVAEWQVDQYIRKVAVIRSPLPKSVLLAKRFLRLLKRPFGGGKAVEEAPMLGGKVQLVD